MHLNARRYTARVYENNDYLRTHVWCSSNTFSFFIYFFFTVVVVVLYTGNGRVIGPPLRMRRPEDQSSSAASAGLMMEVVRYSVYIDVVYSPSHPPFQRPHPRTIINTHAYVIRHIIFVSLYYCHYIIILFNTEVVRVQVW